MDDFTFYFRLGWEHIGSIEAADHLLFMLALVAVFPINKIRQILILVTAFTVGHSITLALSVANVVRINDSLVEFLIPITIMLTAIRNVIVKPDSGSALPLSYFLAMFFGLIHGLAYANTIRFSLAKEEGIALPLFGFNVGLEVAQILWVAIILTFSFLVVNLLKLPFKYWTWTLSAIAFIFAAYAAIDRWPMK